MRKLLLFSLFLLLFNSQAQATITVVNHGFADTHGTSGNAVTLTVGTNPTAGNALLVMGWIDSGGSPTYTVSSTTTDTFTAIATASAGTCRSEGTAWWVASSLGKTGAKATITLTATAGGSNNGGAIEYYEISGLGSTVDVSAATSAGACVQVQNPTAASVTTANANDIVVASYVSNVSGTTTAPATGWTQPDSTSTAVYSQYQVESSTGTFAPVLSCSVGCNSFTAWTMVTVALKASGGAAPAPGMNKRLKLEQYDNGMAISTGGGMQVAADVVGLLLGPRDPSDTTCTESLKVCFADGVCHSVLVGDKPATVSIVKNWSPGGVPQTIVTQILSVIALPNAAVS